MMIILNENQILSLFAPWLEIVKPKWKEMRKFAFLYQLQGVSSQFQHKKMTYLSFLVLKSISGKNSKWSWSAFFISPNFHFKCWTVLGQQNIKRTMNLGGKSPVIWLYLETADFTCLPFQNKLSKKPEIGL